MMRSTILLLVLLSGATAGVGAERVPLWEGTAPGEVAEGPDTEADPRRPTLDVYLPAAESATGTAVVICPGGGYGTVVMSYEGAAIAEFFQRQGVAAFVLRYRHAPRYRHPVPSGDAARAIRLVRARASQYEVAAERIGIMGFSAGGHLAATASTIWDQGDPAAADPIDRAASRPDFAVLCYPVLTLQPPHAHVGSRRNLLGEDPDPELVESLSLPTRVNAQTPPVFLLQTDQDQVVPAENCLLFYMALRRAGVPAELHVFEPGPHGIGLDRGPEPTRVWPQLLIGWMKHRGLLPAGDPAASAR